MLKKIIGYSLLTIVGLAGAGFAYLYFRHPDSRPASSIKVDMSRARVERGKYLFTVADCDGCHSEHDWTRADAPVLRRASGQVIPEAGLTVYVPNISTDKETGIGDWTDGEKIRAIREGVGKDGRALFPMMPYQNLRHMSDDDVQALVAYMNTIPPVKNRMERTKLPFPASMMIKGAPEPVLELVAPPDRSNKMLWGEYLVTLGDCEVCHTQASRGQLNRAMLLAGGRKFEFKSQFTVVSANITPDTDTGIGSWDFARFRDRVYKHREIAQQGFPKIAPALATVMPWQNLATLPEEDLEAIFTYLKAQRPIENKVVPHPNGPVQQKARL